jgi:ABC-type multidrug transport system fused ATPase/permease subunit
MGVLFGIGQFSLFASYATVFYAAGQFILDGTLDFTNMTRAIMCILFSAFGVGLAQQNMGDYVKAKNSFESIFATLDSQTTIDTSDEPNIAKFPAYDINGKIEFKDVYFYYPTRPGQLVLRKLNFIIEPGQSVAFVGYSGSGKSTIVQLLERYYEATSGEILIDGVNIKDYNLLQLRRRIGFVSQEPCLFKRSVKENIQYGDLEATDDQILDAAQKANIMKFFSAKDAGTKDTPVSGGEKQRLAIARAFLKNPKILLLDEATSALDRDSEEEVQKALYALQKERTSITIAHRLSTIENCDRIYVLDHGVIAEEGSHKELYNKQGKYYSLYKSSLSA